MVRPNFVSAFILTVSALIAGPARGDFLYATRYDGTVTQVDTTTHKSTTFVSGLTGGAGGLAFDGSGNLFVTNYGDNSIDKFTPDGVRSVFASGLSNPAGLAFDGSGNLYVAEYNGNNDGTIVKFTPGGVETVFAAGLDGPLDPVIDRSGNLYVSEYSGTIMRFTPAGVGSVFASGLNGPVGLAFDGSGNLFVSSDTADQSIMRFTPDGLGTVFTTTTPYYPTGLAFDSSGNLYAGHDGDGLIDEFSPDGSRTTFSTSGSDTISFIAIRSAVVPEPSSFVLSVVGLSGLICRGLVCRRDRGASASSR
jgi:sugar lactone lactonase YvrE